MKRAAAFLLTLLVVFSLLVSCGAKKEEVPKETPTAQSSEGASSPETAEPEQLPPPNYEFGVYNIFTSDKAHRVGLDNANRTVLDYPKDDWARFTLYPKQRPVNQKNEQFYAIYIGDNTSAALTIDSFLVDDGAEGKVLVSGAGYNAGDKFLWTIEDYEDGSCRIVPKTSLAKRPVCLAAADGKVFLANRSDEDPSQLFHIEKAPAHQRYIEFRSAKGNFITRVNKDLISKKSGVTEEMLQNWTDFMQEAYEKEIELTGFVPYDLIVFSGWENLDLAAGVSDNYNVITAGKAFAQSEFINMAQRNNNKRLGMIDMSFGFLHELGHMFDSNRGWNFESEAWTDLKLCYVIYKMTLDHQKTDGLVFGCASADYPASQCFTYEEMAEALDIHAHKGAMTTVYGFFGAARLFLLMAYDFGWDPFIQTFHWFQDNGYTAGSFERWERFTTFVDKLSEFSGKDIKKEYLTEENWKVFEDYYKGKTNKAV